MSGKIHKAVMAVATEAIDDVFADTTVTQEETIESLMELRGEIDMKIAAMKEDLKRKRA